MKDVYTECLNCHGTVAAINYSDLTVIRKGVSTAELADGLEALLKHFNIYVCSKCGLMTFCASPKLKALAKDMIDDWGVHS